MQREIKEIYEFGPYRLDVGQHRFERSDDITNGPLPEKAFQTLVFLVRNQGRLVTKTELLDAIWPDTSVEENNLNKSIHAVRHALGENSPGQQYIETVPKHGYRFIADARRVDSTDESVDVETSTSAKRSDIGDDKPILQTAAGQFYVRTATVVVLVGIVGFIAWFVTVWLETTEAPIISALDTETSSSRNSTTGSVRSPAYDLYVRGKVKVGSENREDTEAAIIVLEEAVAVDPNFAGAYAQLARGYNTIAFKYSSDSERKRFYELAEVAVEKALALNPELAEGHFARGLIIWTNTKMFPHEKAIQSYKRSLSLDPSLDETHHQLSLVYSHIGLMDEADQSLARALELDPNNTLAHFRVGVYRAYRGRFDEAIAIFKTVPRDFTPLLVERSTAEALIQAGRPEEAEAIADEYVRSHPNDEGGSITSVKALLLAKAGKQKEAEEAIGRALQIGEGYGHFHHTMYNVASAFAIMNRPDEAVRWLEAAAENGFPNYTYFQIDPNLENIREHPRFIDLMKKLKPQWERFTLNN